MTTFRCKEFDVVQQKEVFKITTDAMLLGSLAFKEILSKTGCEILEIGCGTGVISLMLAQRFPNANLLGIDISEKAVECSSFNFNQSRFRNRMKSLLTGYKNFNSQNKYDLIISNPPYFVDDTPSMSKSQSMARHQNDLSYNLLIEKSMNLLNEGGMFSFICPYRYYQEIKHIVNNRFPISVTKIRHNNHSDIRNIIVEIHYSEGNKIEESHFELRTEADDYSDAYIKSMKDYLTIF